MRHPRASRPAAVVHIAVLCLLAGAVVPAWAAGAPTVSIVTAANTRSGAAAGGQVDLRVGLVARGGSVTARVGVRLVAGRRTVRVADTAIVRLRGRRTARVSLTLPKRLRPGRYRVTVCATPATPASCRQAARTLEVFTFRAKGRPLTVTRTVDAERATSATIGPDGGSLTVTAADGSRAVLTLPKGALLNPARITMTPVTALSGHPARPQLLAGVSLAPDGLALVVPGRLELQPARNPGKVFRAVLTGDGEGGVTVPEPWRPLGNGARIDLLHFSSYELAFVGKGDLRGQEALLDWKAFPPPATDFTALRAELARRLGVERQRQLLGIAEAIEGSDPGEIQTPALQAYFDEVVKPLLTQAGTNCEVLPLASGAGLGWGRQVQLSGLSGTDLVGAHSEYVDLLKAALENAPKCLERRCIVQGFPEAVTDFLGAERQAQLLGIDSPNLYDVIQRCLRFTVVLDSEVRVRFEGANMFGGVNRGGWTFVVHGEAVTRPIDPFTGRYEPIVLPLAYTSVTGTGVAPVNVGAGPGLFAGCRGDINQTVARGTGREVPLRFEAFHINPSVIAPRPRRPQDELTFASLVLESGDSFEMAQVPFETYLFTSSITCSTFAYDNTPNESTDSYWAKVFSLAHRSEGVNPGLDEHVRFTDFTRGTNPEFLTRQYVREGVFGGLPYYAITTVKLVHSPIARGDTGG